MVRQMNRWADRQQDGVRTVGQNSWGGLWVSSRVPERDSGLPGAWRGPRSLPLAEVVLPLGGTRALGHMAELGL